VLRTGGAQLSASTPSSTTHSSLAAVSVRAISEHWQSVAARISPAGSGNLPPPGPPQRPPSDGARGPGCRLMGPVHASGAVTWPCPCAVEVSTGRSQEPNLNSSVPVQAEGPRLLKVGLSVDSSGSGTGGCGAIRGTGGCMLPVCPVDAAAAAAVGRFSECRVMRRILIARLINSGQSAFCIVAMSTSVCCSEHPFRVP
jgi:hypothetical protein